MRQLKTFFIRTYGCQMNELDTEIMVGLLEKRGLVRTEDESLADLLIFNTCSIRDLAERKVMGKIGQLGRARQKRAIIGVTGCMAMAKKETLFRKLPHVDFVVGTNNISELNQVLDEVLMTGKQTIRTDDQFEENLDYLVAKRDDPVKAFVSIIRGCDKFCTYCVVPYTRGQEVSRPLRASSKNALFSLKRDTRKLLCSDRMSIAMGRISRSGTAFFTTSSIAWIRFLASKEYVS